MEVPQRGSDIYWLARTASFSTGAVSLPAFLLSLIVLFPSGRKTKALSLVGLGVVGYAISLFLEAYPYEWDSNAAVTTLTVEVYAAGLAALLLCVALAVRSRQKVDLSNLTTVPVGGVDGEMDVDPLTDGGRTEVDTDETNGDAVADDSFTAADADTDAEVDTTDERTEADQ
ncbi:hypothetical protein C2R22_23165 (plasmid) [Salinigranum rubrum]|uniref:Cell division protein A N-terminal domain-containing protein n=1 Tax=Salinigranum rubrum TaxID=755307 RepID=A0A2I8VTE0_9EURY|nr:hypothetical protein [Salinigranum rubrum]AUV84439.1 hypothetical protein C2R22_23165 [Salinigranum rubrum]